MGSNCCKGDAAGRPIRSSSSIYSRSRAGASLDERFTSTDDAGGVRLTVSAARTGDTNVYTLQARNAAGTDSTRVRLEVSSDEAPTGEDPPNFLRRLQDLTVKVGTRTRFLVEIVSSTECKVTWYRNERRLLEAERVSLARDGNFWCADVAAVSVDDAGRWTCTAENAGGRASCSAHLNVLVPKAYKRPEFVEELRALLTEQGTVSLECKVVGVPTPILRWFKDSREIKAGDVFALTANAEDPTSLGTYTCEAVNCMGRAYSSSKVHVVGRGSREGSSRPSSSLAPEPPPIFTKELEDQFVRITEPLTLSCHIVVPPWPRSVVWYNKEGKIEPGERYHVLEDGAGGYLLEIPSAEWPDEGEWKCVACSSGGRVGISTCYVTMDVPKNYRKPRFMENLQAVLTEEGLVSFECKVVGFPTPVLSWFKDGQELKPGDVYQLTGTNSLGSYCCIARNCMGQASSSAELTVEDIQNQLNEEEKHQLFQAKNQAPKFIQGLKSVEAKIDEPFRFTVKVAIPPEPSVLWYRDDQPVDESSRCHHGKEDRGVFYLDIQTLEFLDQAEWKCVAMNDFGHSVTSCFLKLNIPRHYKKPRFLENLQAILSDEGAVNLECKVIGVPQPVLKWYKDGEELKPGDIHRIISGQDGTCCLGTYTCEAQNCMGIAASSASLLGFDDSMKAKKKKAEEQALQRNLSLSTIHEERTSQMYDTPVGDITLNDDKGEISFSFDGKEVSVSLYETPDLTEEEALQIVEMYADQLSENITEHNVVELPPLRFVKETSTSGNLLMEAVIIDVSPDYFQSPDEDLRTEADVEDISIADENAASLLSLDQDDIGGEDYLEKTMALLSEEKSDIPLKSSRKKSDSQRSADDFFSLSRDQSLSEDKKDDDTQPISESDMPSFASAHSSSKPKSKSSKPSGDDGQESSEPTKTILFKDEAKKLSLEVEPSPVVKPKRERRSSRGSRRSSSGSEKSVSKSREEALRKLESIEMEAPKKPSMSEDEFKQKMTNISTYLSKVINDVQIIERDIILKSELMSSAATASRSLEIISSLISPLSEIHSIADATKEAISESKEVSSTLFNSLPQPLKVLQQSLTIIEKCIDMESDSKTLVKKTCVAFIENCGKEMQLLISEINDVTSKDYLTTEDRILTEIESINNEMSTVIKFSSETIKARNLISEANDIKVDEPSQEVKHLRDTQRAVFELKSPLNSLLCIAESADSGKIVDVTNSDVILNDMSGSIQDLQAALEQIESLSVKEASTSLHKYNTEIIETVMESVVKLRTSFEQLSTETKSEDKLVLKQAITSIKENLNKISSQINAIETNVGTFDVLASDNKLDALQKMAQILIALENNLPRLEPIPVVKNHMTAFHKDLTKVLENVIESNESKKYFALMEICDGVNRINASVKNLDVDPIIPLASFSNTLRIIQDQFVNNVFDSELNCSILTNISETIVGIQEAINTADEISMHIDSEHIQDISSKGYNETKAKVIVEHIEHTIAAIENVRAIESTQELKLNIAPTLENICPVLEELKRSVAAIKASGVDEEHISDISEVSFAQTLATPLCELNQNIMVLNQQIVENIENMKDNSEIISTVAEPLHELYTTLEILQQDVISQYGEDVTPYDISINMASAVQNLQSCIVMIQDQAAVEGADEMSTLEDISGIKTTADTIPSDRLVLPTAEETAIEQALSPYEQETQTTAAAQALQTLNEHITVLQTPEIMDALDTLSEISDYSSLKYFVAGLSDLHTGIEEIFHPIVMEGSNEITNLINPAKLTAIAEPMQELQQSLSVLDTSNIPIYENILEMPTEKIHSVIQSVSEFKEHLDRCMLAVFPATQTTDNTVEIANKVGNLREVCEQLKAIFEYTKNVECAPVPKEIKALELTVDNLLDATDVSKGIKIDQVKTITEQLYEKVITVQEEMIQFTPQPLEKLIQEAKLIQTIDEVQSNIAVLEQYDFVDLSRASEISCTSPQMAVELESDSLVQIGDIVDNAVNIVQDAGHETPLADLMIIEDFFKTCKNEFTILRCLISKATSHKKIIRLLQEFSCLQSTIVEFKNKRIELNLSDDINACLATFLIHADDCLENVQTSLVKILNSQADLLIEAPLAKFENSARLIEEVTKSQKNIQVNETVVKFSEILHAAKPILTNVKSDILEELKNACYVGNDNVLVDKIEEFATFVEQTKSQTEDDTLKDILDKVSTCIEKHQDYKDANGTGKTLIIIKCLSDCTDILQENLLKISIVKQKVEEGALKAVLSEILEPLQALHTQLTDVQEQVLGGVDEDSISVDIATTESLVQTMTEKHKKIIEKIESEPAVANEEISLIMEVDKEIHSIQDSLKSIENVQVAQIVKEIAKPVEEIEKSLHIILSSEKVTHDKLHADVNSNIDSLENALSRFLSIGVDSLHMLGIFNNIEIVESVKIATELKNILALNPNDSCSSSIIGNKYDKIKSLKDILSTFDWKNTELYEGKEIVETDKLKHIFLATYQLLAELDKVDKLESIQVNEEKAKQIIHHLDQYIELIEIVEEISAVIRIEDVKETMDLAKELRESIATSDITTDEEVRPEKVIEKRIEQARLAQQLQTALSALQVQVIEGAQELAPALSTEVLQRIVKVTSQLQADLVAVTGVHVALQAPAELVSESIDTVLPTERQIVSMIAPDVTAVASSTEAIAVEQKGLIEQQIPSEHLITSTENLEEASVVPEEIVTSKEMQPVPTEIAKKIGETLRFAAIQEIELVAAHETKANDDVTEANVEHDITTAVSELDSSKDSATDVLEKPPIANIDTLIQHIDQYISEDITEVITELSNVVNAEEMKQSINIAKELRESIVVSEVELKAETSGVLKEEANIQQAQLAHQLQTALAAFENLPIDSLEQLSGIDKYTLEKVAVLTENLRTDLATVCVRQDVIDQVEETKLEQVVPDTTKPQIIELGSAEATTIIKQSDVVSDETVSVEPIVTQVEESMTEEIEVIVDDIQVQPILDKNITTASETIETPLEIAGTTLIETITVAPSSTEVKIVDTFENIAVSQDVEPVPIISEQSTHTEKEAPAVKALEKLEEPLVTATAIDTLLQNLNEFLSDNVLQTVQQISATLKVDELYQAVAAAQELFEYISATNILSPKSDLIQGSDKLVDAQEKFAHKLLNHLSIIQVLVTDGFRELATVVEPGALEQATVVVASLSSILATLSPKSIKDQTLSNQIGAQIAELPSTALNIKEELIKQEDSSLKDTEINTATDDIILQTNSENAKPLDAEIIDFATAIGSPTTTTKQEEIISTLITNVAVDENKLLESEEPVSLVVAETSSEVIYECSSETSLATEIDTGNKTNPEATTTTVQPSEAQVVDAKTVIEEGIKPSAEIVCSNIPVTEQNNTDSSIMPIFIEENFKQLGEKLPTPDEPTVEFVAKGFDDSVTHIAEISDVPQYLDNSISIIAVNTDVLEVTKTNDEDPSTITIEEDVALANKPINEEKVFLESDVVKIAASSPIITTEVKLLDSKNNNLTDINKEVKDLEPIIVDVDNTNIETTAVIDKKNQNNKELELGDSNIELTSDMVIAIDSTNKETTTTHILVGVEQIDEPNIGINEQNFENNKIDDIVEDINKAPQLDSLDKDTEIVILESVIEPQLTAISVEPSITLKKSTVLEQEELQSCLEDNKDVAILPQNTEPIKSEILTTEEITDQIILTKSEMGPDELDKRTLIELENTTNHKNNEANITDCNAVNHTTVIDKSIDEPHIEAIIPTAEEEPGLEEKALASAPKESREDNEIEHTEVFEVITPSEATITIDSLQVTVIIENLSEDTLEAMQSSKAVIEHGNLVGHLDNFVSEEISSLVDQISVLTHSEQLKETVALAQQLKESLVTVNIEETGSLKDTQVEQAQLVQVLHDALCVLHAKALENADEVAMAIKPAALQQVSDVISQLQEDLKTATVSGQPEILKSAEIVELPEQEENSMKQLEVLLQEVTDKINVASVSEADGTESLKDTLDEVQTVIIKLKHDYDGAANDTLNETLEDLECSVRSVQLQINEDSPPELLKEACATLQLLVNNMNETQEVCVAEVAAKATNETILEKCSVETDETIKLLELASKIELKDSNLSGIISGLTILKDTIKGLKLSFTGNTDVLIEIGVEITQSLDLLEEKVFSLERDLSDANISTNTRDSILTAVHSVFGSISNMRGTISSVQKRYMFENYGKPSEVLLRSIKNITVIAEASEKEKQQWKLFSKSLRKVLNHFEDIKFYINFDKTARLPGDAAFTKIILEELKSNIGEILIPQVSILGPEGTLKTTNLLESINKSLLSIESNITLEVKKKIPIFKEVSSQLYNVTEFIKNEMEKQINEPAGAVQNDEDDKIGDLNLLKTVPTELLEFSPTGTVTDSLSQDKESRDNLADISTPSLPIEEIAVTEPSTSTVQETAPPVSNKIRKKVRLQETSIELQIEQIASDFVSEIASEALARVQAIEEIVDKPANEPLILQTEKGHASPKGIDAITEPNREESEKSPVVIPQNMEDLPPVILPVDKQEPSTSFQDEMQDKLVKDKKQKVPEIVAQPAEEKEERMMEQIDTEDKAVVETKDSETLQLKEDQTENTNQSKIAMEGEKGEVIKLKAAVDTGLANQENLGQPQTGVEELAEGISAEEDHTKYDEKKLIDQPQQTKDQVKQNVREEQASTEPRIELKQTKVKIKTEQDRAELESNEKSVSIQSSGTFQTVEEKEISAFKEDDTQDETESKVKTLKEADVAGSHLIKEEGQFATQTEEKEAKVTVFKEVGEKDEVMKEKEEIKVIVKKDGVEIEAEVEEEAQTEDQVKKEKEETVSKAKKEKEAKASANKVNEEVEGKTKKENERVEAKAKKEKEESEANVRKGKTETEDYTKKEAEDETKKEKEEVEAKAKKEKEQAEAKSKKQKEEDEAKTKNEAEKAKAKKVKEESEAQANNEAKETEAKKEKKALAEVKTGKEEAEMKVKKDKEKEDAKIKGKGENEEAATKVKREKEEAETKAKKEKEAPQDMETKEKEEVESKVMKKQSAETVIKIEAQEAEASLKKEQEESDTKAKREKEVAEMKSKIQVEEAKIKAIKESVEAESKTIMEKEEAEAKTKQEKEEAEAKSKRKSEAVETQVQEEKENLETNVVEENEDAEAKEKKEAEQKTKKEAEEKAIKEKGEADVKAQTQKEKAEVKAIKEKEEAEAKAKKEKEEAEVKAIKDKEKAETKAKTEKKDAKVKATKEEEEAEAKAKKEEDKAEAEAKKEKEEAEAKAMMKKAEGETKIKREKEEAEAKAMKEKEAAETKAKKEKEEAEAKEKNEKEEAETKVNKEKEEAEVKIIKEKEETEVKAKKEKEEAKVEAKIEKEEAEVKAKKEKEEAKAQATKEKEEDKAKEKKEVEVKAMKEKEEAETKAKKEKEEAKARKEKEEAEAKTKKEKEEAEAKAKKEKEEAEAKAKKEKEEAEAKAKKEKEEAEAKAKKEKEETEAKAKKEKEETEVKAKKEKEEAEAKSKKENEEAKAKKEKEEAEARAKKEKEEAEAKAKKEAEANAKKEKEEAEANAKKEKEDAEAKAKQEKEEAEAKAKQEKEEAKAKKEKEEAKAKKEKEEAEAKAKEEAEAKVKKEKEEAKAKAKQEKEEAKAKKEKEEAEAKAKQEKEEAKAKKEKEEAEAKAKKEKEEAEAKAKKEKEEAEAKAKKEKEEAEAKAKKEKKEAEAKKEKEEAEARAKKEKEEAKAKKENEEAEVKAKKEKEEAEAKAKNEKEKADAKAKKEKEEAKAKKEKEEAKAKKEKEEAEAKKEKEEAEAIAKQEKEEAKAKKDKEEAEAKAKKEKEEAEAKAKQEKEEAKARKEKEEAEVKAKKEKEEAEAKEKKEAEAKKEKEEAEAKAKKEKEEAKAKKEKEEAEAIAKKEKEEAEAKAKKEKEKAEAKAKKEKEKAEAKAKKEKEEAEARKEKEEAEAKAKKEKEEAEAKAKKEKEEAEAKAKKEKEKAEAKAKKEKEEAEARKEKEEAEAKAKKEKAEAEAKAKKEKEEAKAKKEQEEAEAKAKKEKEEAKAKAKKEKEEAEMKAKKEKEEAEAKAKKEKEQAEAKAKKEKAEAEAKAKKEKEEAKAKEEQEEAEAKAKKEMEEAKAKAKKEKEEAEIKAKKEEEEAKAKKEKEEAEAKAKKEKEQAEGKSMKEKKEKEAKTKKEAEAKVKKEKEEAKAKKDNEETDAKANKEKGEGTAKKEKEENEAIAKKLKGEDAYVKTKKKEKTDEIESKSKKEELDIETQSKKLSEVDAVVEKPKKRLSKKKSKEDDKEIELLTAEHVTGTIDSKIKDTDILKKERQRKTEDDAKRLQTGKDADSEYKREENGHTEREDHYIKEYHYEPTRQTTEERTKFIDHNHRDYTTEFLRPSGYRERTFEPEKFTERDSTSLGKNATVYKAHTLVLDSQLRSSMPPSDRSESERRIDRHRSKALSEVRSLISEKRSGISRDLKRKPVFSTYLTDRTAVEGSRVKLTCSVLSSADPKITWYKNGVVLDNKLKFRTKFVDGLITLEVLNAVPGDSAEYSCTVENENGSVNSSANLKVYPSFEASPIPPTFTRSIRDTYHLAENELVLECRIRGQPLPTITWLKDDRPVGTSERHQAYYLADGVCRLAISNPTPEDSGKYTCKAENSVWSDQITHIVSFTGKESHLSPNIATIERSRFNRQALESRRPHFTNVLSDYKVAKGGTIGLQVEIRGCPTRVEWLREGLSVTELYRNAKTYVEHGLYTLALTDVTEKESGMYTCRAWSSHGNVDMNAAITVVPPNEMEGKPAIIAGRPEKDILISVGEDVNISFRVQGEPKPKVVFMKGIRDITNDQRVCKMTSDDYVKFTLKRSVVSDAGTYCILARNAYGCDRAFVTVVVRQRASSENLISDWTYPIDDSALSVAERKYKSVPDRIPGEPSVVDGGNNWVSLAWPKTDSGNTAPVLAYKIESWLIGKEGGARWIEQGITPLNSFDVFNLKQGEEYHFRVTPRNRYGWGESVQTSSPVGVGLAGDRPEFIEILPGQLKVLAGETANLSCSVKGKPLPEVLWMKNGHEIEDENRVTTAFNGHSCCLTIKDINIEDEGRYSCEATNVHGRASTYARLAVVTDRLIWEADAKLKRERSQDAVGEYPPQFTMRLRDRRVQATYPVRLTCQVIGNPPPSLTWFKDGEDVVFDNRRCKYQDEHFHTLEIAPTTLEDGGVYEAMARNSSGAVSCRCSLVVDKGIRAYVAPEFCCGLEPLYRLTEGEELRISAVVEAYPSVGVTWYRDGVRLRPSRRAIMTLDRDGQIELALASVTGRDAGVYTCTASNEVGRASTSGKVEIIEGEGRLQSTKRTPPVFINTPDVPYSKEPMFIRKPRSSEAREGDTVIIQCEVIGDPKPDVYWLRDFLKPDYYRDATHFKRVGDGPEYRFEIPHAKLDYTGAYSVVARNVHGEAKAIISLQILAKDPTSTDDTHYVRYGRVEVIPRFERELQDLLSYDGDAVEFECRVTGNPEPDIRWFHYNELIRDCPDFESSFDDGAARLKIKQVTAEDEGTYSCEACNNLGKATSSACLVVYPPGEPNTLSQRLRRPPALLSAASTPRSTPRSTPARSVSRTPGPDARRLCSPSRQMAPSFYTYPFNKVVEEGDTVTFQCAVKGQPAPWTTWDKEGIIITPSARITMKEKDDLLRILEIEHVSIEDVGIYRITVENEYGRAEASARLEVITQRGKFYAGVRAYSASPRKSLSYRRYPSSSRQD